MEFDRMRASGKAAKTAARLAQMRQRNLVVLILRHLRDHGLPRSVDALSQESGVSLDKFDVADNIDLTQILQGYEISYEMQYDKKPTLVTNVPQQQAPIKKATCRGKLPPLCRAGAHNPSVATQPCDSNDTGSAAPDPRKPGIQRKSAAKVQQRTDDGAEPRGSASTGSTAEGGTLGNLDLVVEAQRCSLHALEANESPNSSDPEDFFDRQVSKAIPAHFVGELRTLAESIRGSILTANPDVRWDSIVGLGEATKLLKEAVIQPIKYPELFTGLLAPWKGVLLFGPPGTGKTMLAKAVATECKTVFFQISASMVISKWRGDSEKLIRVLFEMAKFHAPATIFIDETDALMMARGGEGEHEASRRMKTELLIQMDTLQPKDRVFVLAATNLPWELDLAILRRLEKRILVGLPNCEARKCMLQRALEGRIPPDVDLESAAAKMQNYSGSDVLQVAREAAMRPLRRLLSTMEAHDGTSEMLSMDPVQDADLGAAIAAVHATSVGNQRKFEDFAAMFGSSTSS